MSSYLIITWCNDSQSSNPDSKKALDLSFKCACLFNSQLRNIFSRPLVQIKNAINDLICTSRKSELYADWEFANGNPFSGFSQSFLVENDLINSLYCLMIERLFIQDYDTYIVDLIRFASK